MTVRDDKPPTWAADPFCVTCGKAVTVTIPTGTGIAAFLEGRPACPACGKPTLQLTADTARPAPVAGPEN